MLPAAGQPQPACPAEAPFVNNKQPKKSAYQLNFMLL